MNYGREAGSPSERTEHPSTRCQHTEDGLQCNRIAGHEESQYEQNRPHQFFDPKAPRSPRRRSMSDYRGSDPYLFGPRY